MGKKLLVLIYFITIALLANDDISNMDKLEIYDDTINQKISSESVQNTPKPVSVNKSDIYTFTDDKHIIKENRKKSYIKTKYLKAMEKEELKYKSTSKKSKLKKINSKYKKSTDKLSFKQRYLKAMKKDIKQKKYKKKRYKSQKKNSIINKKNIKQKYLNAMKKKFKIDTIKTNKNISREHKQKLKIKNILSIKKKNKESNITSKIKNGLNLRDAIIKAVSRNKKILSLREKVIQAKRVLDQKRAGLFPMVNLSGASSKNINSEEGKEDKDNFFKDETQISITENLYAGGKTTNDIKKAKASLKSALAKYQQGLEKEILNFIQAYLSVIYEKKSIKTNRENIKTLNKILNIVTLKEKNGAATKGDLNYIKSNIENTKSNLVLAESKYKNAISYYEYFVGKIDNGNYPVEENIKVSINPNANIEALILKNPQLKELQSKIDKYKYEVESRKSRFKPTIDLILTQKNKSSTLEGDPSQTKKSAALSFNYPLYNGGRDEAMLYESKSKIDELKYKYIDLKKSLTFNAVQILNNINSTNESLIHIKNQYYANQKVVDSYWNAFKYGNQDLQALLLAQNALNRSKLDMLNSQKSYTSQYFQLLSSVGALLRYFSIDYLVNINTINQKAKLYIFRSNFDD